MKFTHLPTSKYMQYGQSQDLILAKQVLAYLMSADSTTRGSADRAPPPLFFFDVRCLYLSPRYPAQNQCDTTLIAYASSIHSKWRSR